MIILKINFYEISNCVLFISLKKEVDFSVPIQLSYYAFIFRNKINIWIRELDPRKFELLSQADISNVTVSA